MGRDRHGLGMNKQMRRVLRYEVLRKDYVLLAPDHLHAGCNPIHLPRGFATRPLSPNQMPVN
jgi:hypothetical protein